MNFLFETNDFSNIKIEEFQDSKIYVMDNFYKYPEQILYYLLHVKEPALWKGHETPSYNGKYFLDLRHSFDDDRFITVGKKLSEICGQFSRAPGTVKTNCIKFLNHDFNDYKNNYWAPHKDLGYTALIYLNYQTTFTNFYEQIQDDIWNSPEHFEPWRSKEKYKVIKKLEGTFNRLIMYDGSKFLHGMDISNNAFFNEFRLNQVLFFR